MTSFSSQVVTSLNEKVEAFKSADVRDDTKLLKVLNQYSFISTEIKDRIEKRQLKIPKNKWVFVQRTENDETVDSLTESYQQIDDAIRKSIEWMNSHSEGVFLQCDCGAFIKNKTSHNTSKRHVTFTLQQRIHKLEQQIETMDLKASCTPDAV